MQAHGPGRAEAALDPFNLFTEAQQAAADDMALAAQRAALAELEVGWA